MIITRTPYRISFFGGGTDYPDWFRTHGGSVLATSINRYCYINCRFLPPFFDHKSRIVWSQIESVFDHREIAHPAIRGILEELKVTRGVEIHHNGDLPARSGLGSSSAFTVGLLHAVYAMLGQMKSKRDLAREAIFIEQQVLKESVGIQDQIQTAFGGLNRIDIYPDGGFDVRPVAIDEGRLSKLQGRLLLFYTGVARHASEIAAEQIAAIPSKRDELHSLRELVDAGASALCGEGDLSEFGQLLHEGWKLKRSLSSKIAPTFVNDIYDAARRAGADGGKLLGAGGGGFMLFCVAPNKRASVLKALEKLLPVPFEFERSGTQLIFYDPQKEADAGETAREYLRYGVDN
jgi:D-glycero-alpha-D-manno-heptose-7-phosphate kinase